MFDRSESDTHAPRRAGDMSPPSSFFLCLSRCPHDFAASPPLPSTIPTTSMFSQKRNSPSLFLPPPPTQIGNRGRGRAKRPHSRRREKGALARALKQAGLRNESCASEMNLGIIFASGPVFVRTGSSSKFPCIIKCHQEPLVQ